MKKIIKNNHHEHASGGMLLFQTHISMYGVILGSKCCQVALVSQKSLHVNHPGRTPDYSVFKHARAKKFKTRTLSKTIRSLLSHLILYLRKGTWVTHQLTL